MGEEKGFKYEFVNQDLQMIYMAITENTTVLRAFIAKIEALMPSLEYEKPAITKEQFKNQLEEVIHEDKKKTKTTQKTTKSPLILEDAQIERETEKAYLIIDSDGRSAWMPKKAIEDLRVDEINFGTITIAHWFKDKISWLKEEDK